MLQRVLHPSWTGRRQHSSPIHYRMDCILESCPCYVFKCYFGKSNRWCCILCLVDYAIRRPWCFRKACPRITRQPRASFSPRSILRIYGVAIHIWIQTGIAKKDWCCSRKRGYEIQSRADKWYHQERQSQLKSRYRTEIYHTDKQCRGKPVKGKGKKGGHERNGRGGSLFRRSTELALDWQQCSE